MKHKPFILFLFTIITGLIFCSAKINPASPDLDDFIKDSLSVEDLAKWEAYGLGKAFNAGNGQYCLMEDDSTLGMVLISPGVYHGDVIVRYKTMALTSSTVLVFMHSVSDTGAGETLTVPEDYNGNMNFWIHDRENYFCAFRNAPHNYTPFIRKYPEPGNNALVSANDNLMMPGKYYSIEIGRISNKLWLSVDGNKILETTDHAIYPGGHLIFRIRGTAGLKAACLIKDLEIFSESK